MSNQNGKTTVCFLFDENNSWIKKHINLDAFSEFKQYHITETYDVTKAQGFDLLFILSYTKIINELILSKNQLNLVVHASDLPKGKGFAPVQWQVLEGLNKIPICLIEAAKNVDSGDIYLKDSFDLDPHDLNSDIRTKQGVAVLKIVKAFFKEYPDINPIPQNGIESFYPRRGLMDSELNIDLPLKQQFNLLRVVDNELYPAFFFYEGRKYRLKIEHDDS